MPKLFISAVLIGLLFVTGPAVAGGGSTYQGIRAAIAESMQWRLSFLPTAYQKTDVLSTDDFSFTGAATLERTRNGISGRVMSKVDTAGDAYTLWVIAINNPAACATPYVCGEPDLFNPDTESSAYNGTGAISMSDGNEGGVVNFDFESTAGPLPEGLFALFGDNPGVHRGNGFGAEIWLIIDIHPPIPEGGSWVDDLTTTNFPGGPARNHRIAIFPATEQ